MLFDLTFDKDKCMFSLYSFWLQDSEAIQKFSVTHGIQISGMDLVLRQINLSEKEEVKADIHLQKEEARAEGKIIQYVRFIFDHNDSPFDQSINLQTAIDFLYSHNLISTDEKSEVEKVATLLHQLAALLMKNELTADRLKLLLDEVDSLTVPERVEILRAAWENAMQDAQANLQVAANITALIDEFNQTSQLTDENNQSLSKKIQPYFTAALENQNTLLHSANASFQKKIDLFNIKDKFVLLLKYLQILENAELMKSIFLNDSTPITRYILRDMHEPYTKDEKNIQRVALYLRIANQKQTDDACSHSVIELTFSDQQKCLYQLDSELFNVKELETIFIDKNAYIEKFANRLGVRSLGSNFFGNQLQGYNEEIAQDYAMIHKKIAEEVAKALDHIPQPVELVFIGCGKGEEIKPMLSLLEEKKIPYVIYGFDLEQTNIDLAKTHPEFSGKPIYFEQGNALEIIALLAKAREENKEHITTQPRTSVTISSGFLTRQTNESSYDAFNVFKQIAHFSDHIFISGRTETLIPRRDAKQSGMEIYQSHYSYHPYSDQRQAQTRTIDHYQFKDINAQVDAIIKQYDDYRRYINLQDHARPIDVIKSLMQKEINLNGCAIDLRQSCFAVDTISETQDLALLESFVEKYHPTIFVTGTEKWYAALMKLSSAPEHVKIMEKNDFIRFYDAANNKFIIERKKMSDNLQGRAEKHFDQLKPPGPHR